MGESLKDILVELATLAERAETCALREALQSNGSERGEALSAYNQLSYCRAAVGNILNPPRPEQNMTAESLGQYAARNYPR